MSVNVRAMSAPDEGPWDAYVSDHSDGSFCHRAGWSRVIKEGAKQQTKYLLAEQGDKIVGVLPLVHRKSFLFGDALISSMFAVYGGPLADNSDVYKALDAEAWRIAKENGLTSLEYRTVKARNSGAEEWTTEQPTAATFRKPLKQTEDDILLDIPRKQRAVVRKSLKAGLTCSWDKDVATFYALYAESVRNLGTPVFPKRLFSEFVREFGDDVDIQVIRSPSGQAIASLMSFYHGGWVLPYYAGGCPEARKYGAHDFMYYQLMLRAAGRGVTGFDFGRSKIGSGPFRFKKNWGFEALPLEYETRLASGAVKADLNPTSKKFELMVKLWKKLPLPVANLLGPPIARHLG
jgi:FemAB-related protein (PEP-CTERM system-associated)